MVLASTHGHVIQPQLTILRKEMEFVIIWTTAMSEEMPQEE